MRAKLHFVLSIAILFGGFYGLAQQDYWQRITSKSTSTTTNTPKNESLFTLDKNRFVSALGKVDKEQTGIIEFPDHQGKLYTFLVRETPILHPDLARKHPQIQSFSGKSLDGKLRIRFSHSHRGVQAMIIDLENEATYFLEKERGAQNTYRAYEGGTEEGEKEFECSTPEHLMHTKRFVAKNLVDGQVLRKYRIAVSATGEYTNYHGGTVADALAAINATLTRVNEVFETDLAVTLELIPENDQIIFTDAATDPYTGSFNAQVQNTLTTVIGEENYDVGHLFHRDNDNGNAGFIGSVCVDNRKGSAFASALIPEGDLYDLDYVAHELGHQFGANHTWSFESEGTGVQVEPASGTTIMGYAGIVEGNNVAPNGDDYFHHISIVQIQDYLETTSCSTTIDLVNSPPTVNSQPDYVIPKGTAFVLVGDASDSDGDVLTYTWEQIDDGVVVSSIFGPDNTAGANFRSLPPTTDPERYFPRLSQVLNGELEQVQPAINDAWETVSNVRRELNFALTVRDNNLEGGQVASDSVKVEVINTSGPFRITSQAGGEAYSGGSVQSITWDVADTNQSPINVETVDIFLSTDGGANFSIPLAQNVPNSGSAQVQLPGQATASARIMVKANDNIFFAVNTTDFSIVETPALLNFNELSYTSCKPDDIVVPFVYETYGGFSENMALSIDGSEPFTANFSQATVSANGTSVDMTLGNISNVPVGTHSVEVLATGASFTTSTTLEIQVFDSTFENVTLVLPEDTSLGTTVNPEFTWQEAPNYSSYDIEIATDDTFTTIVETASVSFSRYQSTGLLPDTTYYWRVKPKNPCGEGVFGPFFSFTTSVVSCSDFDTNDLPQEISEEGTPMVTASIFLAQDLRISDVNVNLELSHTFLEDLTVTLISPEGTRVTLLSKNCGNLNNIIAVFDDDGASITCSGNPAISGNVKPLGSLASFNGESTLGEWVLEVQDGAVSDGGSLDAFSLEICAEGAFRPDEDEDGVFDDGDDLCLGTPKGTLVDTSGCALNTFPTTNFSVSIQSEACRNSNDGSVSIVAADETIDYTASLVGNGVNVSNTFTDQTTFSNLSAGNYQLCIVGSDGVTDFRETCFEVIIEQPEALSVLANLLADGSVVRLQMSGGEFYNIELNGRVEQTLDNELSITLRPGLNNLKVTSGLECQGVFERQFFVADSPIIFPNPSSEWVTVSSNFKDQEITYRIYSVEGRLVREDSALVEGFSFDLNVSELSNGLYYLMLESMGNSQTSKLIKQ